MLIAIAALVVASSPVEVLTAPTASYEERRTALEGKPFTPAELASLEVVARKASREPDVKTCGLDQRRTRDTCSYEISPCLSHFAFILAALEGRSQTSPAFTAWARTIVREDRDFITLPIARWILAKAHHPDLETIANALIDRADQECWTTGFTLLDDVKIWSAGTQQKVEAAIAGRGGGLDVGALVARRSDSVSQRLALEAIRSRDTRLRLGVVRGFGTATRPSLALVDAMAFVAHCDPTARLQREAREQLAKLKLPNPFILCPVSAWRVTDGGVTNGTELVSLNGPKGARCLGDFRGTCVRADNHGEWGGELSLVRADGGVQRIVHDPFLQGVALLQRGEETIVVSSLQHLMGSGGVGQISQVDGGATYEWLIQFTAAPTRWAATPERFFVEFEAHEFSAPCPATTAGDRVVMIYERDGGTSIAQSPITRCLSAK